MSPANPSSTPGRLNGLDLARYLAFVGMVFVNFKIVMGAQDDGSFLSRLAGALEGRAAATFVVLAGIGLGLSWAKNPAQTFSVTLKRAVFLLALGLLNTLIFDADIIHYYAIYFLFGAFLLPFSNRALVAIILGLNLAFAVMILTLDYDKGWNWDDYSYSDFWTPIGFLRNLFFNGWHPVIPWLGFLLLGVILSRLALSKRSTQRRLVLWGMTALVVAEILSLVLSPALASLDVELALLATTKPIPPMALYMLAGIGAASIVVGLCLLMTERLERLGILAIFAPAGRQTLTLYIAHIFIGMGVLEALGMLGSQTIAQAFVASVVFCVGATVYALIWTRWFRRGPIEAAMRKLAG